MSIQFRRGTSTQRASSSETLKAGQPFYEKNTGKLYIGTGGALKDAVSTIPSLTQSNTFNNAITVTDGASENRVVLALDGKINVINSVNSNLNRVLIDSESITRTVNLGSSSTTTYRYSLPSQSGVMALTKDIPIKSATLSGNTLSITL